MLIRRKCMLTRFNLSALSRYRSAKFALALLTMAVCMTIWKEERYVSSQVCCSVTGQEPDCHQQLFGSGVITCVGTITCAGSACDLEVATKSITADLECGGGFAYLNTYVYSTE